MQYNTVPARLRQQDQPQQANTMDLASLLGARIGKDATANFALTPAGLAVLGRDGRYFAMEYRGGNSRLLDVTALVLPIDPGVYRLPVDRVYPGDLILISDSPFSALFVLEVGDRGRFIAGIDATCNEFATYYPPENPFGSMFLGHDANLFVRIVSTYDMLTGMMGDREEEDKK